MTPSRPVPDPFDFERASRDEIALFLAEAALAAGPAVMEVYEHGGDRRAKADGSPVTLADQRAEAIVCGPSCARDRPAADRRGGDRQPAENGSPSPNGSCLSTRSTERENSSPATASSRSMSR